MIGFGKFGKKREQGIVSLDDERLILIDPTVSGFFDKAIGFVTESDRLNEFIEAVKEVREAELGAFRKPIYDPSLENGRVMFRAGAEPAVGYSFNDWKNIAKEIPVVDGKQWKVGSEYQYYAFLVWILNQLVNSGWEMEKAMKAVVIDSKELGHYRNSNGTSHHLEKTGSKNVSGVFDLANTFKMLVCTNDQVSGFWSAGGVYHGDSKDYPLADLAHSCNVEIDYYNGVGWLILL